MRILFSNLKRAIFSPGFLVSAAGVVAVIFLSSAQQLIMLARVKGALQLQFGYHALLVQTGLTSNIMFFALPVLCALPYTASIVDDLKSGFIKQLLPKTTVNGYVWGKGIACALSGGLSVAVGIVCAYFMASLIFLPMELAPTAEDLKIPYLLQTLTSGGLYFLVGSLLSVLGMLFAAISSSKYMAYASPFIIFYFLIIIYERYFDVLFIFYPKEWLNPTDVWVMGKFGAALLLFGYVIIVLLMFANVARRRLNIV